MIIFGSISYESILKERFVAYANRNMNRDGLTSNAFWVLSGFYQEDPDFGNRKKQILSAYQRLDSYYGLKTFHPHFAKGSQGVGRIPNLPQGTAENGATYIHASMFGVMSLFAMDGGEKAWEQLRKLLPFTHEKVSVSPFVLPNSYGYNESFSIDGESMQDWQTGSSNVLLKTLIKYVFGFQPSLKGLSIKPDKNFPFKEGKLDIRYINKKLHIRLVNDIQLLDEEVLQSLKSHGLDLNRERLYLINNKVQLDAGKNIESLELTDETLLKLGADIYITVVN